LSGTANIVEAENLGHRYSLGDQGEILALTGVEFHVKKGEFIAIIGRNGSGKSTLAKHLNALLLPTEGAVWVRGMDTRRPENLWNVRQSAGMVFQNPDNQLVAAVVEEDVAFGPENLGLDPGEIRRRVTESLEAVDMAGYASFAPHLLSGGQKQRVAIAGILAMRPECIILDEPTAMLDPQGRLEVLSTIKTLNGEGITVILITHFMEEAVDADRVLVMEGGQVAMAGSPSEVFSRVDLLRGMGLDVPQVLVLAQQLRAAGLDVPGDLLTVDEMVEHLCQ
jgi:energy-coupling factor transport system ATP-binding protein